MIRTALMLVTWLASLTAVSAFDCTKIVDYNDAPTFADFKIIATARSYLPQTNQYVVTSNYYTSPFIPPSDSVIFLKNENRVYMQVGTLNKNGEEYLTACYVPFQGKKKWFDPDNRELLFDPSGSQDPNTHINTRYTCSWIYVGECALSTNNVADITSFVQQAVNDGKKALVAQAYQDANACSN